MSWQIMIRPTGDSFRRGKHLNEAQATGVWQPTEWNQFRVETQL